MIFEEFSFIWGSSLVTNGTEDDRGQMRKTPPLRLLYNPRAEMDSASVSPFFHAAGTEVALTGFQISFTGERSSPHPHLILTSCS